MKEARPNFYQIVRKDSAGNQRVDDGKSLACCQRARFWRRPLWL